ncbi:MAG: porin [Phycisphaerae bacterium]|nr:porin [Phycisphaerae bacterium]
MHTRKRMLVRRWLSVGLAIPFTSAALAVEPAAIRLETARLAADSEPPASTQEAPTEKSPASQPAGADDAAAASQTTAAWPPGVLMDGLDAVGMGKPIRDLGLRAYGFVESGMTFELDGPGNHRAGLPLRSFESAKTHNLRLNQLMLFLDRPVDTNKSFDIGGTFTFLYGTDARLTHSAGLLDKQNHDVQPDIVQGYGEMWLKTGRDGQGFDLTFGKFFTPIGAESTAAANTYLYSHGYLYNYAEPLTHTGVKLSYFFDPADFVYLGVVRGWDVFNDNNDGASFMGGFQFSSNDLVGANPRSQLAFNAIAGPEQTGEGWPGNRVLLNTVWTYHYTEKLTQVLSGDYGFQDDVPGALGERNVPAVRDSAWYGLAYYLNYVINDYVSTTGRAEVFTDNHGVRTGYRGTFFEATAGLGITPFPHDRYLKNLTIRPELRGDWSANDSPFAREGQFTAAFDVVYKF